VIYTSDRLRSLIHEHCKAHSR